MATTNCRQSILIPRYTELQPSFTPARSPPSSSVGLPVRHAVNCDRFQIFHAVPAPVLCARVGPLRRSPQPQQTVIAFFWSLFLLLWIASVSSPLQFCRLVCIWPKTRKLFVKQQNPTKCPKVPASLSVFFGSKITTQNRWCCTAKNKIKKSTLSEF